MERLKMAELSKNRLPTRLLRALNSSLATLESALQKTSHTAKTESIVKLDKFKVTYGSKSTHSIPTTNPTKMKGSAQDFKSSLLQSGLPSQIITKAIAVLTAYKNILHSIQPTGINPSPVQSLVEICAMRLGSSIQSNIICCLAEEDEQEGENVLESHVLVEEWYEATPNYTWNWILSSHAVDIILQKLPNTNSTTAIILQSFFNLSLDFPINQAKRFISVIVNRELATNYNELYHFGLKCDDIGSSELFFSYLFKQGILSKTSHTPDKSPRGYNFFVKLSLMNIKIALESLYTIDYDLDYDEITESEAATQQLAVIEAIGYNLNLKLSTLFNRAEESISEEYPNTNYQIPTELMNLVQLFPIGFPILAPIIGLFWVEGQYINIKKLMELEVTGKSATVVAEMIFSTLTSLPSRLHNTINLIEIAENLRVCEEYHLEAAVLQFILRVYDRLNDVKLKKPTIPPISRIMIEDRLLISEGNCIKADTNQRIKRIKISKKSAGRKEGINYRFEEMLNSYVVATPIRPTPFRNRFNPKPEILNTPLGESRNVNESDCPSSEMSIRIKPLVYLPMVEKLMNKKGFFKEKVKPKVVVQRIMEPIKMVEEAEVIIEDKLLSSEGFNLSNNSIPITVEESTEVLEGEESMMMEAIPKMKRDRRILSEMDDLDLLAQLIPIPTKKKKRKPREKRVEEESDDELAM